MWPKSFGEKHTEPSGFDDETSFGLPDRVFWYKNLDVSPVVIDEQLIPDDAMFAPP